MRVLMMGTGPFAVPTFDALLRSPHHVVALVTRPVAETKRHGSAARRAPNPMRDHAVAESVPILAPPSVNAPEFADELKALDAELYVVCDYGQILSRDVLAQAPLGGINLHASLLPKYRGAAPVNWAIYYGERETGVTVIHMTPKLDSGPRLVQQRHSIDSTVDAAQLEHQLAQIGAPAVLEAIEMLAGWDGTSPLGEVQDNQRATKAPRLKKHDGAIQWHKPAEQVRNQVRAMTPWPGTYTFWRHPKRGMMRLGIGWVGIEPDAVDGPPGTVVHVDQGRLVVACDNGQAVRLEQIQPAGKKMLPVAEFLRGYSVRPGDRLQATAEA